MKKIVFFLVVFCAFFAGYQAKAFSLDTNNATYNILSDTTSFSLDEKAEDVIYDKNILYTNDNLNFVIITPTNTRLLINPETNSTLISLNFVSPEPSLLSLRQAEDNYYYVFYEDEILYGDFNFVVDGKNVIDYRASGNNVSLKYEDSTIYTTSKRNISDITYYIVLGVGIFFVLVIIIYLVYLFSPKNYTKKFMKAVLNLRQALIKDKKPNKIFFSLKIKLTNINSLFKGLNQKHSVYSDIKKNLNDLNLVIDSLDKLVDYKREVNLANLKEYFILRLDNIIKLASTNNLDKPKYQFVKKKDISKNKPMTKQEEDAYRYLEGTNIIEKN